jgi:osmoprotectant transport system permease protein
VWAGKLTSVGRANAVIDATGSLVGVVALATGSFVSFRPNRIVEGESASAIGALGTSGWIALGLWLLAALGALLLPRSARLAWRGHTHLARGLLASSVLLLLLAQSGRAASAFAAGGAAASRTSFGWSFYLFLFALYLVLYAASADTPNRVARFFVWALPFLGVLFLAAFGALGELGIVREWALARPTFTRELSRHLFYALGATIGAIVLGIPLGVLSARHRRARSTIMGLLSLGQVMPVLAFIGVMIPILGAISAHSTTLRSLGVSGIGWAPVMVVLLVYALFPVVRNTLAAIEQLDPAVLDTAKGMGMGRWRSLWEVELPLALSVVLAGVRIALVQSTSGAIIAAFVGGGGLGTIVFLGLEQTSMDLVLVGVIPIVALALFFDAMLRAVEHLAGRGRRADLAASTA